MTKKFEYIEYEKLSDAVRDWESGVIIFWFHVTTDTWIEFEYHNRFDHLRYAKRIDVKKESTESVLLEGIIEEYFIESDVSDIVENADYHARLIAKIIRDNVKLTGTIKE